MNKFIMLMCFAAACSVAFGEEISADYTAGEKSASLVSPEVTVAASAILGSGSADLMHALRLQMAKYDRDMQTHGGRSSWHGRLIAQEIYTNELCKVEVYSNEVDGAVWRYKMPFRPIVPRPIEYKAPVMSTNGIPARLAEARAKRAAEIAAGTQTVTVTVTADGRSQ